MATRSHPSLASIGCLFLLLAGPGVINAAQQVSPSQKLFGHSVKNGPLPANTEVTTFEHNCTTAPCTITQIHVPSIYPPHGEDWKWTTGEISFYIDDDAEADPATATPTLSMTLLELAGEGSFTTATHPSDGSPYALGLMGKTATSGGVYSTMRIPFQRRLRTTIKADPTVKGQSVYWMIIRGIENYPVVLGDLTLPPTAKLSVYRTGPTPIEVLEMRTLANVSTGTAGAIVRVNFDASARSYTYVCAVVSQPQRDLRVASFCFNRDLSGKLHSLLPMYRVLCDRQVSGSMYAVLPRRCYGTSVSVEWSGRLFLVCVLLR